MAVPVSLLVSSSLLVVASAYGSTRLAFVVTFLLSIIFLERVLSPELVDGFFREVDAVVLGDLRDLRDAIRDEPLTAPIYAAAEERVRRAHDSVTNAIQALQTKAKENLSGAKEAAVAAFLWLRLAAGVANLVATALTNTAFQEAKSRAPSALRWRGVKGLRTSPSNEEEAAVVAKPNTTLLVVWIAAIVAYCAQVFTIGSICSSIASFVMCFPCFAALCGFALMEAERVYLWGSYAIDTTTDKRKQRAGNAAGGGVEENDLLDAWECLWFLTTMIHCLDVCFAFLMLGSRPFVVVSLAVYNVAGLNAARQTYLTADDADADGAHGNVSKWCRAAMKVLAVDVAKVVSTYLLIDFYLAPLLFLSLCAKTAFLLDKAIYLSDECAAGDNDSNQAGAGLSENVAEDAEGTDDNNQDDAGVGLAGDVAGDAEGSDVDNHDGAGLHGDVAGDAEGSDVDNHDGAGLHGDVAGDAEGSDDVRAENSSDIASCDHEEEEGSATEEHSDVSDSEQQRRQESDYSSSSSMDDWSLVGVDPMMPTNVNGGVDRKFRFFM